MVYLEKLIGIVLGDSKYEAPQPINDVSEAKNLKVTHNTLFYPMYTWPKDGIDMFWIELILTINCVDRSRIDLILTINQVNRSWIDSIRPRIESTQTTNRVDYA